MPCWWATMKSSANRSSMRLAKLWYCPSREEFSTSWITGEIWRGRDIKWKRLAAELLISGPQGPSCFWTTAVSILLTIVTSQLCCTCLTKWRKLWPKRWQNRWRKWQKKRTKFYFVILFVFALPMKMVPNKFKAGSTAVCPLSVHEYKHYSVLSNLD